jgi:FtsX-like permease family
MAAVLAWFRLDLRRRWRSLVALGLLITLATGTVMAATAGARRGASAADRLLEETVPATALVAPLTPGFDWEAVAGFPEVRALARVVFSAFEVDGSPAPTSMMLPPADDAAMSSVERPVLLDGRLADPSRSDEVVVTPNFVDTAGKGIGDTVTLRLFTPEQVDSGQLPAQVSTALTHRVWILTTEQAEAAARAGTEIEETYPAAGPVIEATIVGVIRSPWFRDTLDTPGFVVPSAGLVADYSPNLLGASGLASINVLVRLDRDAADLRGFQARLAETTGRSDIDVWNLTATMEKAREVARFEATSLGVFAVVAGLAATLLIGLAVARYVAGTVNELDALNAVGMTRRQSGRAVSLGPTVAAVAGAAAGGALTVGVSPWFPIGMASVLEPTPGPEADFVVLLVGLLAAPLLVALASTVATSLGLRTGVSTRVERQSAIASAAARAGLPVPVVMGTRFALELGREHRAMPVRTVLLGAVAGVAGVAAALTFSGAASDASTNPARVGVLYQFEAWAGYDNVALWPADAGFAAMVRVPGVAAVNDTRAQIADAEGEQLTVFSLNAVGAQPTYVVTTGRSPVGPSEILLGERAARALGARLGDTVDLAGTNGKAEFVVVGIGFVDFIGSLLGDAASTGGAVSNEGYEALFADEFVLRYGQVQLEPGTDVTVAQRRLNEVGDAVSTGRYSPEWMVPTDVRELPAELRSVRTLPMVMAGFLALLALGAVGYALSTAVRRRNLDIAVLRALGMTRRQARSTMVAQATAVAVVGLAVGIPLGLAVGRTIWRYVAGIASVHYVPPTVWTALLTTAVVTLVAANVLATWPGYRAASQRVADVLRAE